MKSWKRCEDGAWKTGKLRHSKPCRDCCGKKGYEDGELKGHVYADVPAKLNEWRAAGIGLGVFSSGSVAAQQLIFGYSVAGDLTPNFSAYFDTKTGGKRETETYRKDRGSITNSCFGNSFLKRYR